MRIVAFLVVALSLLGCKPNAENLKAELLAIDKEFSTASTISDVDKAKSFIQKAERFALANPADSLSSQFLFKAAGFSKTIGQIDNAYRLWDLLIEKYPTDFWAEPAAFLKGFTAETELADKEKAVKYFKEFVERFPQSQFADQAKRQIELLQDNKNPEELVKEFEGNPTN
jgi:outer membrane protein assembly factor BamD (BamD/ComL family)